ncbi:MAG: GxxExxY protein [Planctomycetes bacterium]|nr:GxxExxY protein [Planctomycetota bacterium]
MHEPDSDLDALAKAVVDAAFAVHQSLGPGYLESVYEEALCVELELRNIAYESQVPFHVKYRGRRVGEGRLDLLVGGRLVVELKAVESLAPIHKAQLISYLKATGHRLGLLINFNVALIKNGIQRIILS